MVVHVRYFSDPACSASWTWEPRRRRLDREFGDQLAWTWVMGGLAREIADPHAWLVEWLEEAIGTGMPFDPLVWTEAPISSSYPACMAVKAASEQGSAAAGSYLRALREGLVCFRRKLDTPEALVEEARRARLDVERFRIDLGSHAIVEAFGADLDVVRDVPEGCPRADRIPFPSLHVSGEGGERWLFGRAPFDELAEAVEACGAQRSVDPAPDPAAALARYGPMAEPEVQEVCGLAGPRAAAELWRLAAEWQVKPVRAGTGWLWEPA